MSAARDHARAQAADAAPRSPSAARRFALAAFALLACAGFLFLGTWQVQRLHWKLDLIARVNMRVHAPPAPLPPPATWSAVTAQKDAYRHVRVTGRFLYGRETRVQATTDLGSGYWLLTPLRQPDGNIVLINRGFIPVDTPADHRDVASESIDPVVVTGLLRITEPGGGFLRHNAPAQDRWYSRDVVAIAQARGLGGAGVAVAPFFIDADANQPAVARPAPGAAVSPVGGLTVIRFPNNHLSYALTWYALALMAAGATWWVATDARRRKSTASEPAASHTPQT